jgi:hypothetical protein
MVRWLVADVPSQVEIDVQATEDELQSAQKISLRVRDAAAEPLDNADVKLTVVTPAGDAIAVDVVPSENSPGVYETVFTPRAAGGYVAKATVTGPDGSPVGEAEAGFTHEPESNEFQSLRPNRELLERIADRTQGEVIEFDQLDDFVSGLPNRRIPVTEPWVYPVWHRWPLLLFAIVCLVGEWGLRRWKGWP